jgi:hypothetical protein
MDQPSSYADHLSLWQHRLRAMAQNPDDFKDQEGRREKLQSLMDQANAVTHEQSAATAAKQDASRRLDALMAEGRKLAAFLNACVREQYGNNNEKLAEFKLQPFRGRRSKSEKARKAKAEKAKAETSPTPPEAAQ